MAVGLKRFNRIIDISFTGSSTRYVGSALDKVNFRQSILCPRHGVKPDIQINGTLGSDNNLWAFHIMIKNFYFNLRAEPYSRIKVRAGYANNPITFEANIRNMYQQTPGPDGTTVIECLYGNVTKTWLDTMVDLNYEAGTSLSDIIEAIKNKLNAVDKHMGAKAQQLKLDEPLQFEGSARDALKTLEQRFQDRHLITFMRGDLLCALCLTKGDCVERHVLQYLSTPPQINPGDSEGTWTAQITAPWMPELLPGDELTIPLQTYIKNGKLVGGASKYQKMQVTKMSFHFGTKGSINQMTCDGYIER